MALFPQFPYSNLHELNLDWLIEQISQLVKDGTVISVNGMSGVVTLYTEKDVVFPDRAFDPDWSVYRRIAEKHAGLQFTGEKFYYITKNVDDEEFTIQEVYTSGNLPPFPVTSVNGQTGDIVITIPVTSVNGHTGAVVLAGDNIPYNIDGTYTIEDYITPLEKAVGHVIRGNKCSEGVTAGQYVYLILSNISGRSDGLYKAVNAKSAGTVWTASDLAPVAGGLGALMASNDSAISQLSNKLSRRVEIATETITPSITSKEISVPNMRSYMFVEIIAYCGGLRSVVFVEAYDYIANISCMIGDPTQPYHADVRIVTDPLEDKIIFNHFERGSGWASDDITISVRAFQ